MEAVLPSLAWPAGEIDRVPYRVYTDADLYKRELERIFYAGHWNYVGLACEVPNPGDYRTTWIGERSVIRRRHQRRREPLRAPRRTLLSHRSRQRQGFRLSLSPVEL